MDGRLYYLLARGCPELSFLTSLRFAPRVSVGDVSSGARFSRSGSACWLPKDVPTFKAAAIEPRRDGKLAEKLRTACILDCWNDTGADTTKLLLLFHWNTHISMFSSFKNLYILCCQGANNNNRTSIFETEYKMKRTDKF